MKESIYIFNRDCLNTGFECAHCDHRNYFDSDDADFLEVTGKPNFNASVIICTKCEKESLLPTN